LILIVILSDETVSFRNSSLIPDSNRISFTGFVGALKLDLVFDFRQIHAVHQLGVNQKKSRPIKADSIFLFGFSQD